MTPPADLTETVARARRNALRCRAAADRLEAAGGDPSAVTDWRVLAERLDRVAANLETDPEEEP